MLGHASISRQAACIGGAFVAGIVMAGPVTAVAAVLSERYVCGIREMHPNYTPFHFHYALENQAQYYDDGNNNGMFQRRMQTDFASTDAYGPESQQQSVAGGFDVGSHSLFYPQPSR